jgi:hypothetical protein
LWRLRQELVAIYEAFNSDGASVVVTDADLDEASRDGGPLGMELADAAAQAQRMDLVQNLRCSLHGDDDIVVGAKDLKAALSNES